MCYIYDYSEQLSWVYKRRETKVPTHLHLIKTQEQQNVCNPDLHLDTASSALCLCFGICTDNTTVQNEIVDVHNGFRKAVQPTASDMLRMNYSVEVAASAQAWIDNCILGHGAPTTRMLDGYELGENLFYSSKPYQWTTVIQAWHNEVLNYKYPTGSTNGKTVGHYTQVVWNSSYKVGCGVKLCPNNIYFYGCHYYRAGNFKGWIPYTAGEPCALCPDNCVEGKLCTNPCPIINKFLNCPTLFKIFGCNKPWMKTGCPASCQCKNKIIPVA